MPGPLPVGLLPGALLLGGCFASFFGSLRGLFGRAGGRAARTSLRMVAGQSESYVLLDGLAMPKIGFGTYRIPPGNDTYASVAHALKVGYRMVDTARLYNNEADVGRAIRDSGIPRSEIFVTTKVYDDQHGYDNAIRAGMESSQRLDLGYIDLLLIHSPNRGKIVETYDGLLELRERRVVRSVGVSNFNVQHLLALERYCRPVPVVNQFELHPLKHTDRMELIGYCQKRGILVQTYGGLFSGRQDLLQLVRGTSARHGKSDAQVMLRWALDLGFQVIPKSVQKARVEENFDVFDFSLTEEELGEISSLRGDFHQYWDPLGAPVDVGDVGPAPASCG